MIALFLQFCTVKDVSLALRLPKCLLHHFVFYFEDK